jgi:hypothetical protein
VARLTLPCVAQRRTNPTATTPTINRTASSDTNAAVAQPMPTPITAPGSMMASVRTCHAFHHVYRLNPSDTIRIGSMIPAACTGDITSDSTGTASTPTLPRPPFERPTSAAAITPATSAQGSA